MNGRGVRGPEPAADHESNGVYNLGTGEPSGFDTVVELLNAALGTDVESEYVEKSIPDSVYVHGTCADPRRSVRRPAKPRIDLRGGSNEVCALDASKSR